MSNTEPGAAPGPPVTQAPSVIPLNAASLTRLLMALIAGILIQHTGANPNDAQTYAGLIMLVGAAVWNVFKNRTVVTNIVGALQAPAQQVIHPLSGDVIAPVVKVAALVAVICLAGVHLGACAQLQTPSAQLSLAKAEYTWDAAYNTAGRLYLTWQASAPPAQKAKAKALLVQAYADVRAADTAAALPGAAGAPAQAALAAALVGQAMAIMQPSAAVPASR
jgi:hypothetical protein